MLGTWIRIDNKSREILDELARDMSLPMQDVLAQALESYRRSRIIAMTNAAYAALRASPESWRLVQEERLAWDLGIQSECSGSILSEQELQ